MILRSTDLQREQDDLMLVAREELDRGDQVSALFILLEVMLVNDELNQRLLAESLT